MRIIPAIDLKDGMCVRLFKGDFEKTTEYSANPAEIGQRFSMLAVDDLHIVDLDGARTGTQQNHSIVTEIIAQTGLTVQLGGGIRERDDVVRWLDAGVARCVLGSVAIEEPETVQQWLLEFGAGAIVLALDIKLNESGVPMLTTQGWTEDSGISLWDCIDNYRDFGVHHVLCTDVARDGAMTGPNFDLYSDILARYPGLVLQASGGVRHIEDLHKLRDLGVPAAITGRALLDGKIAASEVASFRRNA
jgi:phosphoribosylformimino-5-aminoimidazole carboxamide ribotide isomerase